MEKDKPSVKVSSLRSNVYPKLEIKDCDNSYDHDEKITPTGTIQMENTNASLYELLKPILVLLAVSACYTYDDSYVKGKDNLVSKRKIIGTIYRIMYLLICLLFCVQGISATILTESSWNFHLLTAMWHFHCLFVCLIFMKADSCKFGNFRKMIHFWDTKIYPDMEILEIHFQNETIKRRQKIYITTAVVLTVFNIITSGLFGSSLLPGGITEYHIAPIPYTLSLSILSKLLAIPLTLVWILPMFYVITISTLLTMAFEAYNDYLEKYLCQTLTSRKCKIQKLRLLHLNLCKMVSDVDSDLGYFYANSFVFSIGLSCFILYQIVKITMSTLNLIIFILWLVSALGSLSMMSIFAACVNEAAHGSLDTLYLVDIKDINKEQLGQLTLFLSKLTGSSIGFTTVGLVTITKEFLLTITGVFLTYFFLLYTL